MLPRPAAPEPRKPPKSLGNSLGCLRRVSGKCRKRLFGLLLSLFGDSSWFQETDFQDFFGTKIRNENSARSFVTEVFGNPLGSWTSAPSGRGCPRHNACFSRMLTSLTEVLGRDIRADDPRMSAGCPSPKLLLWADFSFLKRHLWKGRAGSQEYSLTSRDH